MYQWDKYTREQRERLMNLQISREDAWKEEMYIKTSQKSVEHNDAFLNVVDETAEWFTNAVEAYLSQLVDESRERSRFPEWVHQVFNLGPDRISYIIVRSSMEACYKAVIALDDNEHKNIYALPTAQLLARQISENVWDVAAWLSARNAEPFFYREQSKYFKNWNPKRRRAFTKKVNALPKANQKEKDNFGHAMIRLAVDSGMLESEVIREIQNSKSNVNKVVNRMYVTLNADLTQYLMTRIEDFIVNLLPNRLPMVCRPIDHEPDETGGMMDWSLRRLRRTAQTKERPSEYHLSEAREVDPSCMSAMTRKVINTLQATEWRINDRVLDVARDLFEAGRETGTIPPYDATYVLDMPDFPEEGTPTEQHLWKAEKSRRWAKWARSEASRLQMQIRMHEAYKLKPFVLWHAYFCDFRGRYYSDSYLLHPQGGDLDKALIMAAEPEKVTPTGLYWIKVNLANLMGVDKVSFDDRVKYVDGHMNDWRAVASDPHGTTSIWEDDAPKKNASFQRLAAIFDLIDAIDTGMTQVPVQMDGSCNGIQHWAAMTRDETVGPEVNLVPQDKPADVYQLVANGCTEMCIDDPSDWRKHFLEHWEGLIPRKVVKRSVMCDPYGISDYSVRDYVIQEKHMDWTTEKGLNLHAAANEMGTLICSTKERIMAHCNNGKKFVQLLCGYASGDEEDPKPFSWFAPSGFLVINRYNEKQVKKSSVAIWDKSFQLNFQLYSKDYDLSSAASAMPPNFVHSLDAAHMSFVIDRLSDQGIEFFSMIHDSFGVMANSVPLMREVTKETFHEIHSVDRLAELQARAEDLVGAKLPEGHPARQHQQRGSLDIDRVLDAEYLFG